MLKYVLAGCLCIFGCFCLLADLTQSNRQSHETTLQETIVIGFDTSAPKDSSTGIYPVEEIMMAQLKKGIEAQSTTANARREIQSRLDVELVEERLQVAGKEATKSQVRPSQTSKIFTACIKFRFFILVFVQKTIVISCIFRNIFVQKNRAFNRTKKHF